MPASAYRENFNTRSYLDVLGDSTSTTSAGFSVIFALAETVLRHNEQIGFQRRSPVRLPVEGREEYLVIPPCPLENATESPDGALMPEHGRGAHDQDPVDELVPQPVLGQQLEHLGGPLLAPRAVRHASPVPIR